MSSASSGDGETGAELVTWLREQVEARKAKAVAALHGSDGHWWRQPDEWGHGDLWDGAQIVDSDGEVLGGRDVVVYAEGRPSDAQFDHIEANDPRDTIARCDAELAILDEHASDGDGMYPECVRCTESHPADCKDCELSLSGKHYRAAVGWPCRTVRLLASGYQHRPGYRTEWSA